MGSNLTKKAQVFLAAAQAYNSDADKPEQDLKDWFAAEGFDALAEDIEKVKQFVTVAKTIPHKANSLLATHGFTFDEANAVINAYLSEHSLQPEAKEDLFPEIPDIFKRYNNWLTFKSAEEKAPIISGTFLHAKSNDSATWVSYPTLLQNIRAGKGYRNVGFCPDGERTGYLTAIDIDNSVNVQTGQIAPWALRILAFLGATYTEVTVSGSGLRAWVVIKQDLHGSFGLGDTAKANPTKKAAQIEVVNDKQYMTFSRAVLAESVKAVRELSESEANAFLQLLAELQKEFPATSTNGTNGTSNKTSHTVATNFNIGDDAPEGQRNNTLSDFAFRRWVDECCTEDELRQDVHAANDAFSNPLPKDEVDAIIGRKLGMKQGGPLDLNQKPDENSPAKMETEAESRLDNWLKEGSTVEMKKEEVIQASALLSDLDYEIRRARIAKKLDIKRPKVLDDERAKRLPERTEEDNLQGQAFVISDVEPWQESVDIAKVLDEIEQTFRRFIYFQRQEDVYTTALWCAMTWLIPSLDIAPYLGIRSPEKECGKSTLLKIIQYLAYHAFGSSNVTSASVFRVLDLYTLTMLIDELDTFLKFDSEFVGILNSGHSRSLGRVVRCVGDEATPRWFNTFGAKAYGMIGNATDTLESRSLSVILFPKIEEDGIEDLDLREKPDVEMHLQTLARKLARWAQDYTAAVVNIKPDLRGVTNRKRDNWRPLLQIAEFAGKGWLEKARLGAGIADFSEQKSDNRQFIEDVRNIFHARKVDFLPTNMLLADLHAQLESGWKHYGKYGDGLTQRELAGLVKPYGVKVDRGYIGGARVRGYHLSQFEPAFRRFLRDSPPEEVELSGMDMEGGNSINLNQPFAEKVLSKA
jgi:putative DNA primase/helicase